MKQILWFRRDLRIDDNALLATATGDVLPVFIFDTTLLQKISPHDRRVGFLYERVCAFKKELRAIGLDLAVFHDEPSAVFSRLSQFGFDEVICSSDFDAYALSRDATVEKILPMRRVYDSFLLHPNDTCKADKTPYKVFTPFYNALAPLWHSSRLKEYTRNHALRLYPFRYNECPSLESMGFTPQPFPSYLHQSARATIQAFLPKISTYADQRDYFGVDATSKLSVYLRFGLISPRQVFNIVRNSVGSEFFIRELFWREFYAAILFHFPASEKENFNGLSISWDRDEERFLAWKNGMTGVPIVDAAMHHLHATGMMHNRLRMIVASFLTKNLLLPWQWGERYFAETLLDYEASSNVGSWQWAASTGADSVPYFRVFNPYMQSEKYDRDAIFIKSVIPELRHIDAKQLHRENGVRHNLFVAYPPPICTIAQSREEAIRRFKAARFA